MGFRDWLPHAHVLSSPLRIPHFPLATLDDGTTCGGVSLVSAEYLRPAKTVPAESLTWGVTWLAQGKITAGFPSIDAIFFFSFSLLFCFRPHRFRYVLIAAAIGT